MTSRRLVVSRGAVLALVGCASLVPVFAGDPKDSGKLLSLLAKSRKTLADGITQSSTKAPETAISAKFELDGKGELSLSVYTAEKGLTVDAEHNVLKELAGSPESANWAPEVEVFKDVEHVSRASQQLTVMALSKLSLTDVIKKAEKDQPGTVYAITPIVRDRKAQFAVVVAANDKAIELYYDAMTGDPVKK
jgi:uncharacterized membrane protein YkoI